VLTGSRIPEAVAALEVASCCPRSLTVQTEVSRLTPKLYLTVRCGRSTKDLVLVIIDVA